MGLVDSNPQLLPIGVRGERVTIDSSVEDVYDGNKYTYLDYKTIAASAYSIVTMTTNSVKETTLDLSLETNKPGVWRFSEDAIVSGATAVTVFNNNRKSTNVYDSVIMTGGEIVTVGTVIGYHVVGSLTGGAAKSGGATASRNPWVLAQDTTYMITFLADSADTAVVQGVYFTEGTNP